MKALQFSEETNSFDDMEENASIADWLEYQDSLANGGDAIWNESEGQGE